MNSPDVTDERETDDPTAADAPSDGDAVTASDVTANPDRTEGAAPAEDGEATGVATSQPDFQVLSGSGRTGAPYKLDRFRDVKITVWAELGRVTMPIGDMLQLGRGSVLTLDRSLSEPVDIVAQGVRVARGDVVVVGDCFAVRIKEIESLEGTGLD